ncbi:MAG: hypothetical protein ACLFPV_09055 [Spirochaetaceae bacterium]
MSWECKYKSRDICVKLDKKCDPGQVGCVLHGKVYFPFKPEKNQSPSRTDRRGDSAPK